MPTRDEILAAAERLRTDKYEYLARREMFAWSQQKFDDTDLLMRQYLSDHPADSELPVDEAWWNTIATDGTYWYWSATIQNDNFVLIFDSNDLCCVHRSDQTILIEKPTRGQVRNLLAALGVSP